MKSFQNCDSLASGQSGQWRIYEKLKKGKTHWAVKNGSGHKSLPYLLR